MNGENDKKENLTDEERETIDTESDLIGEEDANVGDLSVEINVEELVAKIESTHADEAVRKREVRQKLEELKEQRDKELDSTFNFNLDDEL